MIPDYMLTTSLKSLFDRGDNEGAIELCYLQGQRDDKAQAWALIRAGWRFEFPASSDPDVMSWYWRSPPKRKGSKGRFYASTNQAYNALMKGEGKG
jgi:hypothetical protein